MPEVKDVVKTLDRADHLTGLARACMWGAVQSTAPRDRWQRADDDLAAAIARIEEARSQLAAVDKQETYCTACGVPLLSQMAGWKHWNGSGSYDADHPADMDWRPAGRIEGS